MAHEVRLVLSASILDLVGPSALYCQIDQWSPQAPPLDERAAASPYLTDGGEQVTAYRNATESIDLFLQHNSKPELQAFIWEIERFLSRAALRQRSGMGSKVYLEFKPDGDSIWWRSEILGGRLLLDRAEALRAWAGNQASALLTLTRRYYWEGALTDLLMTSSVEATEATEVTIYNNDDATPAQTNWVHFANDQVDGSVPSPVKLSIISQEAAGQNWQDIYVAHNVLNDPANFDHWLLGSQASAGAAHSWTGAQTVWNEAYRWDLTTAQAQDARGAFMRLIWCGNCSVNTWMRASVGIGVDAASVRQLVWTGDAVPITTGNSQAWDLGALPVPPGGYGTVYDYVSIFIHILSSASGSATCDALMLGPASAGFRKIRQHGFVINQGDALVDDGPEGQVYVAEAATGKAFPIYSPLSQPLMLWPQAQQRLYVLIGHQVWNSGAGTLLSVKAAYRPRKLSV